MTDDLNSKNEATTQSVVVSLGEVTALPRPGGGRLAENIMHFARTLRAAGLPVGPGKVLRAIRAVEAVGIRRRDDFYWALHAVLVNRRDQQELFDQAFHVFWRNPKILERMLGLFLPSFGGSDDDARELSRRLAEALQRAGRIPDLPEREQGDAFLQSTISYMGGVGTLLEQMSPEVGAVSIKMLMELFKFGAATHQIGRTLEGLIDETADAIQQVTIQAAQAAREAAQQPPQPQPDTVALIEGELQKTAEQEETDRLKIQVDAQSDEADRQLKAVSDEKDRDLKLLVTRLNNAAKGRQTVFTAVNRGR